MEIGTIFTLWSVILLLSCIIPCGKSRQEKSKFEARPSSKSKTSKSMSKTKKKKHKKIKKKRQRKSKENEDYEKDGEAVDKTQTETNLRMMKHDMKDGEKLGEVRTQLPEDNRGEEVLKSARGKRKDDTSLVDEDGPYEDVNMTESKAQRKNQQLVTVDPTSSKFQTSGGCSKHSILNVGSKRIAFKIECSNSDEYRIEPLFGFVEAVASAEIKVLRMPGNPKEDNFVVYYVTVPSEVKDPEAAYKEAAAASTTPVQRVTVPLTTEGPPLKTVENDRSRSKDDSASKAVENVALAVATTQDSHKEAAPESASDTSSARLEKTQT